MKLLAVLALVAGIAGCAFQPIQNHPAISAAVLIVVAAAIAKNGDEAPTESPPTIQIPHPPDCLSNPKLCQ